MKNVLCCRKTSNENQKENYLKMVLFQDKFYMFLIIFVQCSEQ